MQKWKFPDGTEMTFGEYVENGGKAPSKQQAQLDSDLEKGKKGEPMQKVMPRKLDEKSRKGVAEPTAKPSSAERLKAFRKGGK